LRLERHVARAIPVFLAAQEVQRFQPRGLAAVIDLGDDLLRPALFADDEVLMDVANAIVAGGFPPRTRPQWGVDELVRQLLREPMTREQQDPDVDEPGDLGDALGDSIADDVATCATDILAMAARETTRLSELLAVARQRAGEVEEPLRLLDIIWGAALYVFVAGGEAASDDRPRRADLAAAVSALVAIDYGVVLDDARYVGPDLLLATPTVFDRMDVDTDNSIGAA
jgi:hypothetical protein